MAWDSSKPATNSALISADIRAMWASLQAALGNPDINPLTLAGAPTFKPGSSSSFDGLVSGVLTPSIDTTQRANSVGTDTTLTSYTVPANVLSANGKALRLRAWGTFAANANAKQLRADFGATLVMDSISSAAYNGFVWEVEVIVIRTGAATQKAFGAIRYNLVNSGGSVLGKVSAPAETLSGTVVFKTRGQGVATNDILQEAFLIECIG